MITIAKNESFWYNIVADGCGLARSHTRSLRGAIEKVKKIHNKNIEGSRSRCRAELPTADYRCH